MHPAIDNFHNHLDNCFQCSQNPFGLCPEGVKLIKAVEQAKTEPYRDQNNLR